MLKRRFERFVYALNCFLDADLVVTAFTGFRAVFIERGMEGFAFLVSGLVLGIIGATVSATAIALSAVGMAKVRRASK